MNKMKGTPLNKRKVAFPLLFLILFSCQTKPKKNATEKAIVKVTNIPSTDDFKIKNGKLIFLATIIRVIDGDTIEIIFHGLKMRVRLQHIDAPEMSQPYGKAAKKALMKLTQGATIYIQTKKGGEFDRYGRIIGVLIRADGLNINKALVQEGFAWHYRYFSKDASYDTLQHEAKADRRGLWQESNPVAPWNYRHHK